MRGTFQTAPICILNILRRDCFPEKSGQAVPPRTGASMQGRAKQSVLVTPFCILNVLRRDCFILHNDDVGLVVVIPVSRKASGERRKNKKAMCGARA
jgi:hypothetical protein